MVLLYLSTLSNCRLEDVCNKVFKFGPWCTTTDDAQFSEACQHQQEFPGRTLKWWVVSLGCDQIQKKIELLGGLVVVFSTFFVHFGGLDLRVQQHKRCTVGFYTKKKCKKAKKKHVRTACWVQCHGNAVAAEATLLPYRSGRERSFTTRIGRCAKKLRRISRVSAKTKGASLR